MKKTTKDALTLMPVSCLTLTNRQHTELTEGAEKTVDEKTAEHLKKYPKEDRARFFGAEQMWHPFYAENFITSIANCSLVDLSPLMELHYGPEYTQGRELRRWDYGYLADLVREARATANNKLVRLRLKRALAWLKLNAPAA